MNDIFMEKIVARRKTNLDYLKIGGALAGGLVFLIFGVPLASAYVSFITPLLVIAVGYGIWYLLISLNREFEYIVTNGDLDIDMIISKRKRKRVFSGKAKEFELLAKVDSDEYQKAQKGNYKLLDCSAFIGAKDNWFVLADYKGQRLMVVFAPDERMLANMKRFNPNKIKYVPYGA